MCSRFLFFLLLSGLCFNGFAQKKQEREFRIKKDAFPEVALNTLSPHLIGSKRLRYYQELDGTKKTFEVKFKKGRLVYSVEFDISGILEDVEFIIKPQDIPEASWNAIQTYFSNNFEKPRIKKIQQQYPRNEKNQEKVLKDAFQNLLLPYINYEIILSCKNKKEFQEYEVLFDAEGNFITSRISTPSKYDHILY